MEKEKLTSDEAIKILTEWAEYWELDTERGLFKDVIEELRMPVKLQRLTFDIETESFKLQLIKPIKTGKGDGEKEVNFVTIKDCDLESKRVLQRYKDNEAIDAAAAMMSKYTDLQTFQVTKLESRDQSRINAVVMGFITQVEPDKKK